MSDLHGQYDKYLKMLEKISFCDDDELYVLGDVVDRGERSSELLRDMSMRANVFPILGNHDLIASYVLKKLCTDITEDNYSDHLTSEFMQILADWQSDGGQPTLDGFQKLSPDEREYLLEYLDEFSHYEVLEVGGKTFVLVHGGVPYDKRKLPLSKQAIDDLAFERPDYSKRYFENSYLVTGHTPTVTIDEKYRGKIFKANGHIAVDCGAGFGLPLGCIRLDDLEEFYVD